MDVPRNRYHYAKTKKRWKDIIVPAGSIYGYSDRGDPVVSDGLLVNGRIIKVHIYTKTTYGYRWIQHDVSAKTGVGKEIATIKRSKTKKNEDDPRPIRPSSTLRCSASKTPPPQSAILTASISVSGGKPQGFVTIVSNPKDQNTQQGVYWIGRTAPSLILAAIQINPKRRFEYNGVLYRVSEYEKYERADKYFDMIVRFCNPVTPQTIYIFAHKNLEKYASDNYEMVTALIPCFNTPYPVPLTVYYEKSSKKYFINETTYHVARKRYGLPHLRLYPAPEVAYSAFYGYINKESILHLFGYNVGAASGLSVAERRSILTSIIDGNILAKHDVVNHLEWLIHMRQQLDKQQNAVSAWESDLWYILNYKSNQQRPVWVNTLQSRISTVPV